jgi:hypothetical protein
MVSSRKSRHNPPFCGQGEETMAYKLEGSLLEVCDCEILCPCWVGEAPDNGTCQAALAYHFERGTIDGVDVSGLTLASNAFLPGTPLAGNWRVQLYIDERATKEQEEALLSVFTGKQGGPVADLVSLIGEVVGIERAPITFEVKEGKGTLRIGNTTEAVMEPYRGPTGKPTTLVDSIFSTIPGSPAYVAKASMFRLKNDAVGLDVNLRDHNAIQGLFAFEG